MLPSAAIKRFDLSISFSEFNTRLNRSGFVGLKALPPIMVGLQNADFRRILVESVLGKVENTLRAPKGTYSRGDFEWSKDSYATGDHGVEEIVDDRDIKIYRGVINAEMIHTERAMNRVLMALENEIAGSLFNTNTFTGAALTTAVATPWSTAATAKPIDNIDAANDKVRANIGQKANTLILTDIKLRHIKRCAQITDLLKYSGHDDPKNIILLSGLSELLEIEKIIVAKASTNTADEGTAATFAQLWNETMAMVCYTDDSPDLESTTPCIGRTIMWSEEVAGMPGAEDGGEGGVIMEEYREEDRRGGVLRARMDYQAKLLHVESGHLLTNL